MAETGDALRVERIVKAYGATVALDHASFTVHSGEVHALLGENGAGKSTTVKILSGLLQPDEGAIELFGERVYLARPTDAQAYGVQTAYQEMTLVGDLNVTENMLLPRAPTGPLGQLRRRKGERLVAEHLASLSLGQVDPRTEIRDLALSVRQRIEIARAVFRKPKILLLDEPTSALSGPDIDWLGELIDRLVADGVTIVFISHRMPEVRRFCDRLTVLRNGKDVGTADVGSISDEEVVRMIIGRSLAATFPPRPALQPRPDGTPFLEVRKLATDGRLKDANFSLWPGEILGVAALQGMGQRQLFLACFGMATVTHGAILVDGREVTLASPQDALRGNIGIGLLPEERKTEGLFLKLDGCSNVSLPVIDRYARLGVIDWTAVTGAVSRVLDEVEVARRALYTPVG
ncbi:MAG: sugar ABC transporter ATP-binding protein, partial [Acetobacteraceae bacterium]|nr:sugar ABC transporter ATP-binding protein [Acetobacteraceae bacterium]